MEPQSLAALDSERRAALIDRDAGIDAVREDVRAIIDRVRTEGDTALRSFSAEFDDVTIEQFDITDRARRAVDQLDGELFAAIHDAADNIRAFHDRQRPTDWRDSFDGRELGRRFRPIERVGVYAPGGTAAYPSSALMGIIPATVAGVEEIVAVTPPAEEINPVTLAAIDIAGADEVYQIGGAQAIGALAYGTESIEAVEKIVGPGNAWVTAAKTEVQGDVAIDFAAGPSEVLVIADATAEPAYVAADLIAQAEHDPNASVVAVTDDQHTAEAIETAVERQAGDHPRADIIDSALGNDASGVFVAESMETAITFAEAYAAEHLSIQAADEEAIAESIANAGSVFIGPYTPVAAGDYASGTNHVLPTTGRARVVGGLSVDTFMRSTTIQRLDRTALGEIGDTITTLARAEGFDAHAASVERRLEDES